MISRSSPAAKKRRAINAYSFEELVALVEKNGGIIVSWRWSDDHLRSRLHTLVKKGLIRKGYCGRGADEFFPLAKTSNPHSLS